MRGSFLIILITCWCFCLTDELKQARVTEHIATRTIEYVDEIRANGDSKSYHLDKQITAYLERGKARIELGKIEQAISDLDIVIKKSPVLWEAYYLRGKSYVLLNDPATALPNLNYAIENGIIELEAYFYRGLARFREDTADKGLADLEYVQEKLTEIEDLDNLYEAYIYLGKLHSGFGQFKQSLADYSEAININPKYPKAYFFRGNLNRISSNIQQAISDFDRAESLGYKDDHLYLYRGLSYVQLNRKQMGETDLSRFLKSSQSANYNRPQALLERGMIRYYHNELDSALIDIEEAINLDPSLTSAYGYRGMIHCQQENCEEAMADLETGLGSGLMNIDIYYFRAINKFQDAQYNSALSNLVSFMDVVSERHPFLLEAYYYRGMIHYHLEDYTAALQDLNRAISGGIEKENLYMYRGNCFRLTGDYVLAIDDLIKAKELEGFPKELFFYYGMIDARSKNHDGTISDLTQFIDVVGDTHPYWEEALFKRADAYIALEKFNLAIQDLDLIIQTNPASWESYYLRGKAYILINDPASALSDLEKGINGGISIPEAHFYRGLARFREDYGDKGFADLEYFHSQEMQIHDQDNMYESLIYLGKLHSGFGQFELAIKNYTRALQINTYGSKAYFLRGNLQRIMNKPEQAISDLNQAETLGLKEQDLYLYRGLSYLELNKNINGEIDLSLFLKMSHSSDQNRPQALIERGIIRYYQEKLDSALLDMEEAIKLDPTLDVAYGYRGMIHCRQNNCEQTATDLETGLHSGAMNNEIYFFRSINKYLKKEYIESLSDLLPFMSGIDKNHPFFIDSYFYRGAIYYHLDDFLSSENDLNIAISGGMEKGIAYMYRGDIHRSADRYEFAKIDLDIAKELGGCPKEVFFYSGLVNNYLGNHNQTITDLTQFLKLSNRHHPDNDMAMLTRAIAHYEIGEYEKARKQLNEIIRRDPVNSWAYRYRGKVHYSLNRSLDALTDFNLAVSFGDTNIETLYSRGIIENKLGHYQKAYTDFSSFVIKAEQDHPDLAEAFNQRGLTRFFQKDTDGACIDWNRAAELGDNDVITLIQKNCSYMSTSEKEEVFNQ